MKRVLFVSDTHGDASAFSRLDLTGVDEIVHLGDGAFDGEYAAMARGIPYAAVRGNNDFGAPSPPDELVLSFEGVRVFCTHGHRWRVKWTLLDLEYAARERNCALAVYGHTHRAAAEWGGEVFLLNPGSLAGLGYEPAACAVVTFDKGGFSAEIKRL